MEQADREIIEAVIEYEGGLSNNPADPGGLTKWGITLATFRAWTGGEDAARRLVDLTRQQAVELYYLHLVIPMRLRLIAAPGVRFAVFDYAVQHGPKPSVIALQQIVGVQADGIIGPVTAREVNGWNPLVLIGRLAARRGRLYLACVRWRPSTAEFAYGWGNRLVHMTERAYAVEAHSVSRPIPPSVA